MINLSYKTLSASMLKHFKIKLCTGFLCLFVCSLTFAQSKSETKSSCSIAIQKAESTWENGSKDEAIKLLQQGEWTGNIRELRNIVERLIILCDTVITADDVKTYVVK